MDNVHFHFQHTIDHSSWPWLPLLTNKVPFLKDLDGASFFFFAQKGGPSVKHGGMSIESLEVKVHMFTFISSTHNRS